MQHLPHRPSVPIFVLSVSAWALSVSTSELRGSVQDTTGAAIAYARVQLTQTATGALRTVNSKVSGQKTSGGLFIWSMRTGQRAGHRVTCSMQMRGEYIVEVGSESFRLTPGDSILGRERYLTAGHSPAALAASY
jgi:hypothetical protein